MRDRMSNGMRFTGVNEFLHPRMVVNAVVVSSSSRETSSKVKLQRESTIPVVSQVENVRDVRRRRHCALELLIQSEDELGKGQPLARISLCGHLGDESMRGVGGAISKT